ncbi:MAG: response regulator [Cardiobacteriales bacterium]|nr:MAG: response regulator [Cardiobacteriales bacterium]
MYTVMVVDDSMVIRERISQLDEKFGFQIVCQAKNGKDALDRCRIRMPDIITMDLTMPEMDGLEAIPKLLEINPDAKILVVSALSDLETGLEALELGANGFLNKPFNERSLSEALMELVSDDDD